MFTNKWLLSITIPWLTWDGNRDVDANILYYDLYALLGVNPTQKDVWKLASGYQSFLKFLDNFIERIQKANANCSNKCLDKLHPVSSWKTPRPFWKTHTLRFLWKFPKLYTFKCTKNLSSTNGCMQQCYQNRTGHLTDETQKCEPDQNQRKTISIKWSTKTYIKYPNFQKIKTYSCASIGIQNIYAQICKVSHLYSR